MPDTWQDFEHEWNAYDADERDRAVDEAVSMAHDERTVDTDPAGLIWAIRALVKRVEHVEELLGSDDA